MEQLSKFIDSAQFMNILDNSSSVATSSDMEMSLRKDHGWYLPPVDYSNDIGLMTKRLTESVGNARVPHPDQVACDVALLCAYIIDRCMPVIFYGSIFFSWDDQPLAWVRVIEGRDASISIDMAFLMDRMHEGAQQPDHPQSAVFEAVKDGFMRNPLTKETALRKCDQILWWGLALSWLTFFCILCIVPYVIYKRHD